VDEPPVLNPAAPESASRSRLVAIPVLNEALSITYSAFEFVLFLT
jgi:hypothetical protein